jgi:hypothetical protein
LKLKQAVRARLDADMVRHAAEHTRLVEEEQQELTTSRLQVAAKDRRIALLAQRRSQRETIARQVGVSASAVRDAYADERLGPLLLVQHAKRSMDSARLESMPSQPRAPPLHRPHVGLHVPWTAHVAPQQPHGISAHPAICCNSQLSP